jgi:hypothetical protein
VETIPEGAPLDVSFEPMGAVRVKGILRDVNPMKVIFTCD